MAPSWTGHVPTVASVFKSRAEDLVAPWSCWSVAVLCRVPLTLVFHLLSEHPCSGHGAFCSHFISSRALRLTLQLYSLY